MCAHGDCLDRRYNDIANRLRAASDGIEALDEKQNWINHELNDSLAALRKLGDKALADWDILEEFKIEMPDEDFDVRWMTYGWPKKMQEIQAQADERMAEDRERFKHNLIQNVQEFAQKINHLQKTVSASRRDLGSPWLLIVLASGCRILLP